MAENDGSIMDTAAGCRPDYITLYKHLKENKTAHEQQMLVCKRVLFTVTSEQSVKKP